MERLFLTKSVKGQRNQPQKGLRRFCRGYATAHSGCDGEELLSISSLQGVKMSLVSKKDKNTSLSTGDLIAIFWYLKRA